MGREVRNQRGKARKTDDITQLIYLEVDEIP